MATESLLSCHLRDVPWRQTQSINRNTTLTATRGHP